MKQITKTVRTLAEMIAESKREGGAVTQNAVERARTWLIAGIHDFNDWHEYTLDTWKDALAQIGFTDADIRFSGFSSQGDGASFTASVDLPKLIDFMATDIAPKESIIGGEPEDFRPWIVFKIGGKTPANRKYRRIPVDVVSAVVTRTSHHYSHENTCEFSVDGCYGHDRIDKLIAAFTTDVEHLRRDICRAIYKDLEEEYEWQTSDEQLIDMSEANEYTFDKYGRREG